MNTASIGRVASKVALVTGGASGIGRATALLLAREGARVAIGDHDPAAGDAAVAALRDTGAEALFVLLDVRREADWDRAVSTVVGAWGRLDVLVNNAGIGHAAAILDTSLEDWRRVMAVNMESVFLGTRAAMRVMPATGGGSIVNLSSIAGLIGAPLMGAYAASKGGVRLFSKVAALECAQAGLNIRVNSVHPAFIDTPLVRGHVAHTADPEKTRRYLERFQPIGRMGRPEEIAEGILYLASDASSFVTGSELVIDGGVTAA